ncbi:ABC transporter permease [Corynebacterium ammoniagenes]|nr:ABC transporter permease [Corynebacterium ammoniagenes]AQS73726.1 ABC transporter permease [Corynebacterium ammoniagenes]NMF30727.1 ABC transporter permease [Corynebacterium ammoniagenes]
MKRTVRRSVPVDKFKTLKGENRLLVIGIPILVIVAVVGWGIWRATATLDDIEARTLDPSSVLSLTWEHLVIVVISAVIVLVTAIPLGIVLTRPATAFLSPIVTAIANIGQAAPVIGVIVLLAIWLGFGAPVAIAALWFYAFLPVLANVVAGLRGVDKDLVEAARGLSLSPMQVLFKVELPLALPVIMNGVRTALVLLVGAGAFATFIDAGGLGGLITAGINLYRNPILISGAVLIAALALAIEWVGRVLEIGLTPKGMLK